MTAAMINQVQQEVHELREIVAQLVTLHQATLTVVAPLCQHHDSVQTHIEQTGHTLAALREQLQHRADHLRAIPSDGAALTLDRLTVGRIDIVEPNGTCRMILANAATQPPLIMAGEIFSERPAGTGAGILFYNSQGDECGALTWDGANQNGSSQASAGLFFDQFQQDQILQLAYQDEDGKRSVGLTVWDRPQLTFAECAQQMAMLEAQLAGTNLDSLSPAERNQIAERGRAMGLTSAPRMFVGRNAEQQAVIELKDDRGRVRLQLATDADGTAQIAFFDAEGHCSHRLS
jgi:hypothetical protein